MVKIAVWEKSVYKRSNTSFLKQYLEIDSDTDNEDDFTYDTGYKWTGHFNAVFF